MYEQQENYMREEEHLAVAASTDPHLADAGVVEQEEKTLPRPLPDRAGCGNPATDQPNGDNRHLPNLPSSEGVGRGRDCQTCKRNFWTSVLNAITKIATIVLAGFGLQSFQQEN